MFCRKPRALPSMVGSISKPAKMRIAHVPDVEDPSQQLIPIIPIVKQHPPVGQKLSEQPGSSFYSKTITKEVKYGQSSVSSIIYATGVTETPCKKHTTYSLHLNVFSERTKSERPYGFAGCHQEVN